MKEIEINYKNWSPNDVILDLARLINDGFCICSYSVQSPRFNECDVTVSLITRTKED